MGRELPRRSPSPYCRREDQRQRQRRTGQCGPCAAPARPCGWPPGRAVTRGGKAAPHPTKAKPRPGAPPSRLPARSSRRSPIRAGPQTIAPQSPRPGRRSAQQAAQAHLNSRAPRATPHAPQRVASARERPSGSAGRRPRSPPNACGRGSSAPAPSGSRSRCRHCARRDRRRQR